MFKTLWNNVVAWFTSKGGFAHVIAAAFALGVLAYAQVPSFANLVTNIYNTMPTWAHEWILAAIGVWTWYKNTQSITGSKMAIEDKTGQKLGAWALISLLLLGSMATGCSATTVAQDIVNWTPTIQSTAATVGQVVAGLDPAEAVIIEAAVTGFNAAAGLLSAQAQTYLNNPGLSTLQQLQAQALSFQQNANIALLQALKVSNPVSQQRLVGAIQALVTGLTAVLALISTIKGNTLSRQTLVAPVHVAQLLPYLDRGQTVAMVSAHYQESTAQASTDVDLAYLHLQQAGL